MRFEKELDGFLLSFRIRNYQSESDGDKNWDSSFSNIDFSVMSGTWLDYTLTNSELLMYREVEELMINLKKLLIDDFDEVYTFECAEPDFRFVLHPKRDLREEPSVIVVQDEFAIEDVFMEWQIYFWNGYVTDNYLSIRFEREDIQQLFTYLQIRTKKIDQNDENFKRIWSKGIFFED